MYSYFNNINQNAKTSRKAILLVYKLKPNSVFFAPVGGPFGGASSDPLDRRAAFMARFAR